MQISQHCDVDMWGRVCMSCFRGAWQSLNFYKEYLFGFEFLVPNCKSLWIKVSAKWLIVNVVFATLQQLVTLQRERKTWNLIIWPLQETIFELFTSGPQCANQSLGTFVCSENKRKCIFKLKSWNSLVMILIYTIFPIFLLRDWKLPLPTIQGAWRMAAWTPWAIWWRWCHRGRIRPVTTTCTLTLTSTCRARPTDTHTMPTTTPAMHRVPITTHKATGTTTPTRPTCTLHTDIRPLHTNPCTLLLYRYWTGGRYSIEVLMLQIWRVHFMWRLTS